MPLRAGGEFNGIPVEGGVGADAGGGPAAVLEHGDITGHEGGFGVFAIGHGDIEVLVEAALELETLERFGGVESASGAVSVEETAAGGIEPDTVGTPPGVGAVAVDIGAQGADFLRDFQEGVPGPFAFFGKLTRVGVRRLR